MTINLQRFRTNQVYLNWAKTPVTKKLNANNSQKWHPSNYFIEDISGVKFQRKHFPADSRQDCWFCLASPSCEKHLIVKVYNTCYSAMPKGPIHPGHVLLIPVQHTDCGIWNHTDKAVPSEIRSLIQQMRTHANNFYDCDLFVFERAIATKGGYHSHIQCIPVAKNLGSKIQLTLLSHAAKSGFDLQQINSEFDMDSLIKTEGSNPTDKADQSNNNSYFYCEIPTINQGEYNRFLHQSVGIGQKKIGNVPTQFGREVMAAVLGKPDLAHWKSCIADRTQEETMTIELRESLNKLEG
jgi:diadenosine tetraphosphate (Ap4A) HIT family hydrolase